MLPVWISICAGFSYMPDFIACRISLHAGFRCMPDFVACRARLHVRLDYMQRKQDTGKYGADEPSHRGRAANRADALVHIHIGHGYGYPESG